MIWEKKGGKSIFLIKKKIIILFMHFFHEMHSYCFFKQKLMMIVKANINFKKKNYKSIISGTRTINLINNL